jgi:hypothetical protein
VVGEDFLDDVGDVFSWKMRQSAVRVANHSHERTTMRYW